MQVPWRMVLADLTLSVDQLVGKETDGTGDQGPCLHWLLDRDFFLLSEPCCLCSNSWGTLLKECIEGNISSFNGASACNLDKGNFLVHGANSVCPHCTKSKVDHIHSFLSDIVSFILTD